MSARPETVIYVFVDELRNDGFRIKLIRSNQQNVDKAVNLAIGENIILSRCGLRERNETIVYSEQEAMKIDQIATFVREQITTLGIVVPDVRCAW